MSKAGSLHPSIEANCSLSISMSYKYIHLFPCIYIYVDFIIIIDQEARLAEPQGVTNTPYVTLSGVGLKRQREQDIEITGGGSNEVIITQPDASKARATPLWVQKVG